MVYLANQKFPYSIHHRMNVALYFKFAKTSCSQHTFIRTVAMDNNMSDHHSGKVSMHDNSLETELTVNT